MFSIIQAIKRARRGSRRRSQSVGAETPSETHGIGQGVNDARGSDSARTVDPAAVARSAALTHTEPSLGVSRAPTANWRLQGQQTGAWRPMQDSERPRARRQRPDDNYYAPIGALLSEWEEQEDDSDDAPDRGFRDPDADDDLRWADSSDPGDDRETRRMLRHIYGRPAKDDGVAYDDVLDED